MQRGLHCGVFVVLISGLVSGCVSSRSFPVPIGIIANKEDFYSGLKVVLRAHEDCDASGSFVERTTAGPGGNKSLGSSVDPTYRWCIGRVDVREILAERTSQADGIVAIHVSNGINRWTIIAVYEDDHWRYYLPASDDEVIR